MDYFLVTRFVVVHLAEAVDSLAVGVEVGEDGYSPVDFVIGHKNVGYLR